MDSNIDTVLISSSVLPDVNLLLGIDIYDGGATEAFYLPKEPSPWEVAYILIRFATYAESIVFFEQVKFLWNQPLARPIEDHLYLFTNEEEILQPIADESILWRPVDERYESLCDFAEKTLFPLKGFQGLFRDTKAYRDVDTGFASSDFSSPLISPYWASSMLYYNFYASPIDSLLASYDSIRANVELTSRRAESEQLAVLFARNLIEKQRDSDVMSAKELGMAFDISLPAILTVAIRESSNLEDIMRNVIRMRKEARRFRKKMRKLDESQASAGEMQAAISDLEHESKMLGLVLDAAEFFGDISGYVIIKPIIYLSKTVSSLAPPKKNFVRRLKQSTPRVTGFADKISEIFRNSGYRVDGNEVLKCISMFVEPA